MLDVKVTEDNSFPLASLIPLFPDIKRKARVELQQAERTQRAPSDRGARSRAGERRRCLLQRGNGNTSKSSTSSGRQHLRNTRPASRASRPSTAEDSRHWAGLTPTATTGVAIAISFRGACNTGPPSTPPQASTSDAGWPCFEDGSGGPTFATVGQLCNQGARSRSSTATTRREWPTESVQAGLQFIRGYATESATGLHRARNAYLE